MPAKIQNKKMCAKKVCMNINCPFPHPKPYQPVENALKPQKKFVFHGAASFTPQPSGVQFEDLPMGVANFTDTYHTQRVPQHTEPSQDELKTCIRCHKTFVFTIGEAKFFIEQKFSMPKRCKDCRAARRNEGKGLGEDISDPKDEDRFTEIDAEVTALFKRAALNKAAELSE